jgi:hypothetical protein
MTLDDSATSSTSSEVLVQKARLCFVSEVRPDARHELDANSIMEAMRFFGSDLSAKFLEERPVVIMSRGHSGTRVLSWA